MYLMTKVELIDQFDTSAGRVFNIRTNSSLRIGDLIMCDSLRYKVNAVLLATRPGQNQDTISVIVENV